MHAQTLHWSIDQGHPAEIYFQISGLIVKQTSAMSVYTLSKSQNAFNHICKAIKTKLATPVVAYILNSEKKKMLRKMIRQPQLLANQVQD